ncbi:hypothetical protein [Arachidicoccus soli]|uniref:Uncharacterized protein n=1 Tax=Arachidicoccus soli TaxID=2341117 RepID=A0A386HS71_9BACT|nr:hypothetical protein [Arachidicoccus soli]AYD48320.1 hypothetical protein D6B99_12345 [Arachidicoccus soli]
MFKFSRNIKIGIKCSTVISSAPLEGMIEKSSLFFINTIVQRNYLQIKQDIQDIIQSEMERMLNDPGLAHLVVRK